jgi:hypothetical protein
MNKRRLLKLADLLEADAANECGIKFDLGLWASTEGNQKAPELNCGTTACAVGLACISGAFKRQGLTYTSEWGGIWPHFDGLREWEAVEAFFGLSASESEFLFVDSHYYRVDLPTVGAAGERAVAKRIRDFVAGKAHP